MNIDEAQDSYTITLDGRELAALARFASSDANRVNLFGLGVHRSETEIRLSATDGHRLCTASQQCGLGASDPVMLQGDIALLAKHAGLTGSMSVTVNGSCTAIATVTSGKGLTVEHTFLLERKPVPIDQVIPKARKPDIGETGIGVNPRYLADLATLTVASGHKEAGVCLTFGQALDPILCTCPAADDGTQWQAVIMPMRLD